MKQCPACNQVYDDSLSFCLNDGTALINGNADEKTLVMYPPVTQSQHTETQQIPARRKSRFMLWVGLIGLVILAGVGLLVGALYFTYSSNRSQSVQDKRQIGVNIPTSTKSSTAPKASPTVAPEKNSPVQESSPKAETEKSVSDDKNAEDAEDITPIGWDTTASGFKGEPGQTYTFQCPEEGTENSVYGSDIYTQDSSICTAAVHAGIITLAKGGAVTIEYRPGRLAYGSTIRNGIKSKTWGEYPRSFVVR